MSITESTAKLFGVDDAIESSVCDKYMCDSDQEVNENTVCDVDTYQVGEFVNFSKRNYECVARADKAPVSVRGNLSHCFNFWEKQLNASPAIFDIVKTGFKLSFVTTPPKTFLVTIDRV